MQNRESTLFMLAVKILSDLLIVIERYLKLFCLKGK